MAGCSRRGWGTDFCFVAWGRISLALASVTSWGAEWKQNDVVCAFRFFEKKSEKSLESQQACVCWLDVSQLLSQAIRIPTQASKREKTRRPSLTIQLAIHQAQSIDHDQAQCYSNTFRFKL